ncbi:hypothetical protein CTAM01_16726 [Colletotrichum tamarilloi]|uniref:Uncharacterized protein n=1 Tax=Colletotrichum tamarilloi TaxID=1209934 RepID=A0ABQ9QHQ6_9PEZI|nr:uncharacterized protein CTAM01_16726 [Colletotrichum tamarilloi]KAK1470904.1 hypothetical protein CTAM01_16726 [Colletotrichum tamarilloi]
MHQGKDAIIYDSVDQLGQEDLRNLTLPLLVALPCHVPSISLPSTSGCGSLQNDFLRLISAAASDSFDFSRVKPLLKAAFSGKLDDATIWDQAHRAITETTPPSPPPPSPGEE